MHGNFPLFTFLQGTHESIDLVTAALLLTGQLAPSGLFIVPAGINLSLSGPVLGGVLNQGITPTARATLRAIEVLSAVLLVGEALTTVGLYITAQRASIVLGGPILETPKSKTNIPGVSKKTLDAYQQLLLKGVGKTWRFT
ncbi:hypothetical protein [Ferroacidibacillus organovorans]|uniref:Uncharacterized protein n=1 Tax=Ferroacidibacillus organovorans TaxID=1765683 RepID=A0A162T604_9BACL|nr:hypothetical protein [Ferroacidibacillus organovorans]KYP80498.1 hypothetical protein AYJ22_02320 [Ferroacidibacillus organovorans]OAG94726.1 hypothetical protein AYW79_04085 [Ferroacidibacillus organovorans]OPG16560.1 hypothetical protein B2M26_06740 [Ferroacidibacillus organovorans]